MILTVNSLLEARLNRDACRKSFVKRKILQRQWDSMAKLADALERLEEPATSDVKDAALDLRENVETFAKAVVVSNFLSACEAVALIETEELRRSTHRETVYDASAFNHR